MNIRHNEQGYKLPTQIKITEVNVLDHTNYEADRSSKTVNIGSHIPDVICMDKSRITHKELVGKAAKWLKRHKENACIPNCSLILQELSAMTYTGETPDVIGFSTNRSIMIEVKVSRSDFLADKKKMFRSFGDYGMGQQKFYCCPEKMIKVDEIPVDWGLLSWTGKKIIISKIANVSPANIIAERTMLLSVIRRVKEGSFDLSVT